VSIVAVILCQLVVVIAGRIEASFGVEVRSGVDCGVFARSRVHAHVILVRFHPKVPSARKRVSQIFDFGQRAWTTSIGVIACFLGRRCFDLFTAVGGEIRHGRLDRDPREGAQNQDGPDARAVVVPTSVYVGRCDDAFIEVGMNGVFS